jgi:hydrogenase maturation factor
MDKQFTEWALLWSQRQNALHVEELALTMSKNRQAYTEDKAGDYVLLHIGTHDEVIAAAEVCHATLSNRAIEKGLA